MFAYLHPQSQGVSTAGLSQGGYTQKSAIDWAKRKWGVLCARTTHAHELAFRQLASAQGRVLVKKKLLWEIEMQVKERASDEPGGSYDP